MSFTADLSRTWKSLPSPVRIGAIGAGAFLVYKIIQRTTSFIPPAPLPTGGYGIPTVGYTPQGTPVAWSPEPLVDELHNVMSTASLTGTKDAAWQKVIDLPSPDMVAAVYNRFNQKWGDGDTLTQWIDDEFYYDYFSGVKDQVLQKLRGQGLAERRRMQYYPPVFNPIATGGTMYAPSVYLSMR